MRRKLIFLPEVSSDYLQGFNYYEELSPGRGGARFEAAFRNALEEVRSGIRTHMRAFEHFHRVLLRRFPYTLYYRLRGDEAIIVGVLFARADPKEMQARLRQRI